MIEQEPTMLIGVKRLDAKRPRRKRCEITGLSVGTVDETTLDDLRVAVRILTASNILLTIAIIIGLTV